MFLYTKMTNVAGIQTTDAQKSSDMYLKCRYLDELTGGKGITFATGTPISNSMVELVQFQDIGNGKFQDIGKGLCQDIGKTSW